MKNLSALLFFSFLLFAIGTPLQAQQSYAPSASEVNPALTGTEIPNASVKTAKGTSVELRKLVSEKPTVLIFYRGGWCPYCNAHLAELQKVEQQLVDMGYQILAVSPDRPELLRESIAKHELQYTLLSDSPMKLTKAFGLAFKVDKSTLEKYRSMDIYLEKDSGYDHHLLPVPAVYLINPDGMITFQYVNPNYKTRINSEVLLTAAEAYHPGK